MDELTTLETTGLAELAAADDEPALKAWNTKFFGDKGQMKAALAGIGKVAKDQRAAYGLEANRVKGALEAAYASALAAAKQRALEALGYVILRVTWHQVVYEPDRTLKRIEAFLLANREPPVPRAPAT